MKQVQTALDGLGRVDVHVILANQHEGGAFVASPTFTQYPFAWLRDGAFIAHALDSAGHRDGAARFHDWVADVVERHAERIDALTLRGVAGDHPDEREFLPARFAVDGTWPTDDWPSFQLDGYGQWLWSLERHAQLTGGVPPRTLRAARAVAEYLSAFRFEPCYDAWEEGRTQLHTSTLASTAAGLFAAHRLLGGSFADAADDVKLFMERECVSDDTASGVSAARFVKRVRGVDVDASLLWLTTPFALWPSTDPRIEATVRAIEHDLRAGGGVQRYAADTFYGGGAWILLTAWLGWHHARSGERARARELLTWVDGWRDAAGHLPEQVAVSGTHPVFLRYWTERWGAVARPLLWSHAMRLLLALEVDGVDGSPPR